MCHRHTTKPKKDLAKALPSVTLGKQHTTSTVSAQRPKPLSKGFAKCNTRQTAHNIYSVGKQLFAECFLSRTRQMVCRVSNLTLGKKKWFAECFPKYTRQNTVHIIVCQVFLELHSANLFFKEKKYFFLSIF